MSSPQVACDQLESGRSTVFAPFMLRIAVAANHWLPWAIRALMVYTSPATAATFATASPK